MRKRRTYQCEDCGVLTTRARATVNPLICLECGIKRMLTNDRQLQARKGPYYERWLAATGRGSTTDTNDGGA